MAGAADKSIRVVVGAHEPLLALGLQAACDATAREVACVGSARDGDRLLAACAGLLPHVAVADPALLKPDRISTVAAVARVPVSLLLLADDTDLDDVAALLHAGAAGVVPRDTEPEALVAGVRAAAAGTLVLEAAVTRRLLDRERRRAPSRLTPREREVLGLVAAGRSTREIGGELFVSETTVKTHLERINEKLGTRRRSAAVAAALRLGLLEDAAAG